MADTYKSVVSPQKADIHRVAGFAGQHSYAQEEISAFAQHFNQTLQKSDITKHLLPIDGSNLDLVQKVHDGLLLCEFINVCHANTIDPRALNKIKPGGKPLSPFQIVENLNVAISSAKSIGIKVTNIGASELQHGEEHVHIVLGLIWQLVKQNLLNDINLKSHPELVRLLEKDEELADLLKMPPEDLLLRWFNYHLKNSKSEKRVHNFSNDVKDSEAYTLLLNQISPNSCSLDSLSNTDTTARAESVLTNVKHVGVEPFIKASDIVAGNSRLNLIFTASIFNTCPGLDPPTAEEVKEMEKAGLMEDDVGDSREERAFRMWINSLGIADTYINNLFEDCNDGLVLLRVLDYISPNVVQWKQVEMKPTNKFKKVSNCNYVTVLGKQLKFSLVGIQGSDIVDKNKKLILALVWQMMRYHTLKFVAAVRREKFGDSGPAEVNDDQIISWANQRVQGSGKSTSITSFKDSSIKTGVFMLDLITAIEPQIINTEYVKPGTNPEDALLNARYAISVARKLGAVIFCLPEDIVEVKPKMILTFLASIMAIDKLSSNASH